MAKNDNAPLNAYFKVVIPGFRQVLFSTCEGLESEIGIESIYDGGTLAPPRTARGVHRVNRLTLSNGSFVTSGGRTLFDWFLEVGDSSKPLKKELLSIVVQDSEGNSLTEWHVANAWPCRWVAPLLSRDFNAVAVEHISFAHEGITRK